MPNQEGIRGDMRGPVRETGKPRIKASNVITVMKARETGTIACLTEVQRAVIDRRYPSEGEPSTLNGINCMGIRGKPVTKERKRQIEQLALRKIRARLAKQTKEM